MKLVLFFLVLATSSDAGVMHHNTVHAKSASSHIVTASAAEPISRTMGGNPMRS